MSSQTSQETQKKPGDSGYGGGNTPLSYNTYLKVEELKKLQVLRSDPGHHDEPLFIIIHQTYELWFKLILHELDLVLEYIKGDNPRRANFYLRRVVAIMKVLVEQIHILETMAPKDFLGFRNLLNPASGFQSSQFREIEFLLGARDLRMLEHFKQEPAAYELLTRRFSETSLREAFYDLLERRGFKLPRAAENNGMDENEYKNRESEKTEARVNELKKLYDDPDLHPELHDLAESMVDIDELILLWRNNHVMVVERIIGFKQGTGGSEGVGYLRSTLSKKCFPDLWLLRTYLTI